MLTGVSLPPVVAVQLQSEFAVDQRVRGQCLLRALLDSAAPRCSALLCCSPLRSASALLCSALFYSSLLVQENRSEIRMPRVALFASRAIEAGSELSMHYGYDGEKEFECACDWCKERDRAQSLVQHQTNRRIHSLARKKKIKLAEESANANPTPTLTLSSTEQLVATTAEASAPTPSASLAQITVDAADSPSALALSPSDALSPVPVPSMAILDFCGPPGEAEYDDATSLFFGTADASVVDACAALQVNVSGGLSSHAGYLATLRSLVGPDRLVPVTPDSCWCVLHLHPSRTALAVFTLQSYCASFGNAGSVGWHEAQIELMRAHVQEQMLSASAVTQMTAVTMHVPSDGDVAMPALEALAPGVGSIPTAAAAHIAPRLSSCSVCSAQFANPLQLCAHRSDHLQLHQCRSCSKVFASSQRLRLHEAQRVSHPRLGANNNRPHHHAAFSAEPDWFGSLAPRQPLDPWVPRRPRKTRHHSSSRAIDEGAEKLEPDESWVPDSTSPASATAATRPASSCKPALHLGLNARFLLLRFRSQLVRVIRLDGSDGASLTVVASADLGMRVLCLTRELWTRFCSSVEPHVTRLFASLSIGSTVCRANSVCLTLNLEGAQQAMHVFADDEAKQWFSTVLEPVLRGERNAEQQWMPIESTAPKTTPRLRPPAVRLRREHVAAGGIAFSDLRVHTLYCDSIPVCVIELPPTTVGDSSVPAVRLLYGSDARRLFGLTDGREWKSLCGSLRAGLTHTVALQRWKHGHFVATPTNPSTCWTHAGVRALMEHCATHLNTQPATRAWLETTLIPALSGEPMVKTEPAQQASGADTAKGDHMDNVADEAAAATHHVALRLSAPMPLPSDFHVLSLRFTSSVVVLVLQFEARSLVFGADLSRALKIDYTRFWNSIRGIPPEHVCRMFARVRHNEFLPSKQTISMLTLEGCRVMIRAHNGARVAEWFDEMLVPACECEDEEDGAAAAEGAAASSEHFETKIPPVTASADAIVTLRFRSFHIGVVPSSAGRLLYGFDLRRLWGIEFDLWRSVLSSMRVGLMRRAAVWRVSERRFVATPGCRSLCLTAAGVREVMNKFGRGLLQRPDERAWMEETLLPILSGELPIKPEAQTNAQSGHDADADNGADATHMHDDFGSHLDSSSMSPAVPHRAAASLHVVSALNSLGEHHIEATLARAPSSAERKQQVNPHKGRASPVAVAAAASSVSVPAAAASGSSPARVPLSSLSQFLSPSSHVGILRPPVRAPPKPASEASLARSTQQSSPPRAHRGQKRSAQSAELVDSGSESDVSAADDSSGRSTPSSSASVGAVAVPRAMQQQLPPKSRQNWTFQHHVTVEDWAEEGEEEMPEEFKAAATTHAAASSSSAAAAASTSAASAAHTRPMRAVRAFSSELFPFTAPAAFVASDDDCVEVDESGDDDEEEEYRDGDDEVDDEDGDASVAESEASCSRQVEYKRGTRLGLRSMSAENGS